MKKHLGTIGKIAFLLLVCYNLFTCLGVNPLIPTTPPIFFLSWLAILGDMILALVLIIGSRRIGNIILGSQDIPEYSTSGCLIFAFAGTFFVITVLPVVYPINNPLSVIVTILVLSSVSPIIETSISFSRTPKKTIEMRPRFLLFSIVIPMFIILILGLHLKLLYVHSQPFMATYPSQVSKKMNSSLEFPMRLAVESWIVSSAFSIIIAWQIPILSVWGIAGVGLTILTLAVVPIGRIISSFQNKVLIFSIGVFQYVPKYFINALLYLYIVIGMRQLIAKIKKRLGKTVSCPNCHNKVSPLDSYCKDCGQLLLIKETNVDEHNPVEGDQ
jgi:hypothetical protein